jgi:hypothetical protein
MEYNIGFVIGDPSGDGHACTTEYHIVANHSVDEIAYEGDTYAETLRDVDDTYKVLNGELYRCDDTQYPEDTSYLVDVRSNGDGTYEYIAQFYNGGTYLDEVLEDGIKNTLK